MPAVLKHLHRLVSSTATLNSDAVREIVGSLVEDKNREQPIGADGFTVVWQTTYISAGTAVTASEEARASGLFAFRPLSS